MKLTSFAQHSTFLVLFFASLAGFGLFQVKYQVVDLKERLEKMHRQIQTEKEAIHMLKAEWAYLNEPERLQKLALKHLKLETSRPTQLVSLESLSHVKTVKLTAASPKMAKIQIIKMSRR